jgi:hypothetical protein
MSILDEDPCSKILSIREDRPSSKTQLPWKAAPSNSSDFRRSSIFEDPDTFEDQNLQKAAIFEDHPPSKTQLRLATIYLGRGHFLLGSFFLK